MLGEEMSHALEHPGEDSERDELGEQLPLHAQPGRDVDLAGRNLVELGKALAFAGDAGAAEAALIGALGSTDPAVAGDAAASLGAAAASHVRPPDLEI